MKITGPDPGYNQQKVDQIKARDQQSAAAKAASSYENTTVQAKSSETVAVSGFAREAGKAGSAAKASPDIRKEKVDEIKAKIAKGEYYVSSDKIAGKVIEDIIRHKGK